MDPSSEIKRQFAAFQDEGGFEKRLARVNKLPANLEAVGRGLIRKPLPGESYGFEAYSEHRRRLFKTLAGLSSSNRQRLFTALFPSIAEEAEAAWNLFDHLPYQDGFNSRPFRLRRSQTQGDASITRRCAWIEQLLIVTEGYNYPVTWFAEWASHLGWNSPNTLGFLFAGAIDRGGPSGQEVFNTLIASARGDHPIGKMGRHVTRGLLCSSRSEGWEFIEHMLVAAQREEGLRQVILETTDEAHPEAFKRLLRLVIDQNLVRFSAVVRAAAVWTGFPFEAANPKAVSGVLVKILQYLEDPDASKAALATGSPEETYLALWSIAFEDTLAALSAAELLLSDPDVEHRFVAAWFLTQLDLVGSVRLLLPVLADSDVRVATCAYYGFHNVNLEEHQIKLDDLFERLEAFVQRLPEDRRTLKPIIWEWMILTVDRKATAAKLALVLGDRPIERLLPYLNHMNSSGKVQVAEKLLPKVETLPHARAILLSLIADRDTYVQQKIHQLLGKLILYPEEILPIEALLVRKSQQVRSTAMELLLRQPDNVALDSIDRLLLQRNEQQRLAGLEMLRDMVQKGRAPDSCQARVARLQATTLSDPERHILSDLLVQEVHTYTLRNALGLVNPEYLSQPIEPRSKNTLFGLKKKIRLGSKAAAACILALDDLIDIHRTEPVQMVDWQNEERTELLGNVNWQLVSPDPALSRDENLARLPLRDTLEQAYQERPTPLRDDDGFELLRAQAAMTLFMHQWVGFRDWTEIPSNLRNHLDETYTLKLKYDGIIATLLDWLVYLHPAPGSVEFLLDAVEELCFRLAHDPVHVNKEQPERSIILDKRLGYLDVTRRHRHLHPHLWQAADHARLWGLVLWLNHNTIEHGGPYRPHIDDMLLAFQAGAASEDDLLLFLLDEGQRRNNVLMMRELRQYSGRQPHPIFKQHPMLQLAVERCRERILAIELQRGDLPTAASVPALNLRSVPGMANMLKLLAALGKAEFNRRVFSLDQSRSDVFSHLIRVSYPLETDTPKSFAAIATAEKISEHRLVELAVYAPQWARFVEHTLGWAGMEEGVWWLYAHTKDRQWVVDQEIRQSWMAQIGEHTPLSPDALMDGAVDVSWFHRVYAELGEDRWKTIYRAARYASSGAGHARARLYADAMLGKLGTDELITRVQTKRNQNALRALGLVPLPVDETDQADVLTRYRLMQDFLQTSKQFGSQRQASERLAASIALENLAHTAGFPDSQRLTWAMEIESVSDLAEGPVSVQSGDITVSLSVNALGEAEMTVVRGEKILKNIPHAIKKVQQVTALVARKKELGHQASQMRLSLETAMVRGDIFHANEIQSLFCHPLIRPMLEQLIFVGASKIGYPVEDGHRLEGLVGYTAVESSDRLRLAHPIDLLENGSWHEWQRECFLRERIQPFKQVFRELYVLTENEQDEKNFSRRYAGQQLNPRQALGLFGTRGWVVAPEEGVFKTFHAEGLTARVGFLQTTYTPADVEGLTIELVGFTRRGEWKPLPLGQIPPRLFSEVMRDLDLVVSIAHSGGVDPESSASTVEARATLVQETCALLKLANVQIKNRHALVDGRLGNYTIHLGSAVVHKQPGGSLCIVPVHAQHRGRLFLPFADNDPKSAEVVSKVILLAKDHDIKDPTILEQIFR